MKTLNRNIDIMVMTIMAAVFIGSFMLTCVFLVSPKIDYGNMAFVIAICILSGYYWWKKI